MDLEVDWNRLIIGGWHLDTRREKVEAEAKDLLRTLGIQESVKEVIVYGRRASACHVLLEPQPAATAKNRLGAWISQHKDKHLIPSSGQPAWLTPHKSAHKRLKNRATKHAASLLESTLSQHSPEQTDIDWNKQILWHKDLRVLAFSKADLLAPTNIIHEATYTDPRSGDELIFYIDLTRVAKITGKEVPALQAELHQKQE